MELHEALYTTRAMRMIGPDPIPLDVQGRIVDAELALPPARRPRQRAALAPLYQHAMGELWKSVYKARLDAAHAAPDEPGTIQILRSSARLSGCSGICSK